MATAKKPVARRVAEPVDTSTKTEVNQQQHSFSGETVEIKLFKAEGHEPKEPFFGLNNYQITLQRDKWIRVPVELADHIETLEYDVQEPDPEDPDNMAKATWVKKQRFPLQRRD
jgi:hypothetical protein